ncbi:MAG: lamin tail domain-containing protein, partial [Patescibacteria group bacterium]|nr:lamin tail domain-containing protein [Patescibacteria group bacterium]
MIKQNIKTILILAFVCAGFFCFEKNCWAIDHIVISEIQITGEEFVELYNPTNNEINMTGWYWCYFSLNRDWNNPYRKKKFLDGAVIKPKKYYLIAMVDGELSSADWSLGYSRHFLNDANGSVVIFLSDPKIKTVEEAKQGKIDAVGWGNVDYVKEKNPVIFSGDDQSIKRKIENSIIIDSDDNDADFFKQPSNNVSNGNGNDSSNGIDGDDVDGGDGGDDDDNNNSEEKIIEIYKLGDIVINEFVSDPADGEVEWIELYNTTSKKIILTGWTIKEGSGAKTTLEGVLAGSGENKFFIIEKPKGNLNNKGDIIILRDGNETLIDQVAYGKWEDGNTGNNAPMTGDPYSVARKFDGQNSFNNANDFAVTTTLTKGASNIITKTKEEQELTDEISAEEKANYDYSNNIIISEIFPNPAGSDKENEFIELFNKGERDVNLTGWRLGDESKKKYEVRSKSPTLHSFGDGAKLEDASEENNMIIKAGGYLVVYRGESKIALNNGSDSAKLYQPLKDEPLQAVKYEKAIEGWSYNYAKYANERQSASWRTPSEKWVWSEIVTPGTANEIKTINHPPIVDFDCPEKALIGAPILFDSSDTIDEDGDKLKFNWSFGDGFTNELANPEHTFFKQGAWTVKLTVSDGENEIEKEKIVKVANTLNVDGAVEIEAPEGAQTFARLQAANNIIINEFLPNPEGADAEGEFIELYNQGGAQVNLINWKVDDSEAGSK